MCKEKIELQNVDVRKRGIKVDSIARPSLSLLISFHVVADTTTRPGSMREMSISLTIRKTKPKISRQTMVKRNIRED